MSYSGVDRNVFQQGPVPYNEQHLTQETEPGKLTAQTEVGITKDAVEQAIEHGHKLERQETTANAPILPSPAYVLRVANPFAEKAEGDWADALETLLKQLPDSIERRVRYEKQLPFSKRNEEYSSLLSVLNRFAFALAFFELASSEVAPSSPLALSAQKSAVASEQVFSHVAITAQECCSSAKEILSLLGRNALDADRAYEMSSLQEEILEQLQLWQKNIREEGVLSKEKAELDQIIRQLYSIQEGIASKKSRDFNILNTLLHVEIAVFGMLDAKKGIRPLLLGLATTSIGEKKGLGLLGKAGAEAFGKVAEGALGLLGIERGSSEGHWMLPLVMLLAEGSLLALHGAAEGEK